MSGWSRSEPPTPSPRRRILPGTTRTWILAHGAARGLRAGRDDDPARRPGRGRRGVPPSSVAGILPLTWFAGRADRQRPTGPVDRVAIRADREVVDRFGRAWPTSDDPRRAHRPHAPARRRGRPAQSPTRRSAALQTWLQLSDDLLCAAWGIDGSLPPRLADGRQAEGHRPGPADDARRGGRLRPRGRGGRRPRPSG